ncbi:tellurite resistance TerB family protein [Amaricoccus solimangrovi]|uniref:Tellurite resistance TerB family protein n=1 Tax=Amaricoccus solimangrovi TaxID=2589815 RepID=A0A501WJU0_9RHOB|nr:tellurite resistance TerB family protein [Amaricoccus solimangrovi]TPE50143.1 tellurite resistance TerB family protein [Amaricoccus solimangrovi]
MSLGAILEQMMRQGGGGGSRLDQLLRNLGGTGRTTGGGLGDLLGQLQGALAGATGGASGGVSGGGTGGLAGRAKDFLGREQVGGLTGGQLGGIGAIAGALLGGGAGGAAKGGAMAILGTLALGALRAAQAERAGGAPAADIPPATEEIASVTGPEAERLVLLAMISAAKADGSVDEAEMKKIIGKAGEDGVTEEEKQFVLSELTTPVDIDALAARVTSPTQAAAVYAASLLTITPDTPAEKAYLSQLAAALRLDPAAVEALEKTTGA